MGPTRSTVLRAVLLVAACTAAAMLGFGPPAMAQEAEPAPEEELETAVQTDVEHSFEDEITVTGSLIPRPSLDSLSPVTVLDAQEELTVTGTTRIEDLLLALPQVYPAQNSTIANGATGTASIDLRYLGPVRTLTLLNGRRMAFGDVFAADVNAVPAALVKRVDVLTGGASTVYGSDAVGGVVNFVLDTDFTGVRGGIQYSTFQHDNNNALAQEINAAAGNDYPTGTTWDGGATNVYIAVGGKFADGRGHGSAYIGYRKIDELVKASRDYLNCSVDATEQGPECSGSSTTARGRFISFDRYWRPLGDYVLTLSEEGGDGHSFRERTGEVYNYGPYNHIQRPDEKWNAGGFAHYTISEHFEPYIEVMFMRDYTDAQIAPSAAFYGTIEQINCDNPMLSEQQRDLVCTQAGYEPDEYANLFIWRRNEEGAPRSNQIGHTNYRLVGGIRGDIDHTWSYDFYGLHAQSGFRSSYVNDLNRDRVRNAIDVIVDPDTGEWVCRSGSDDGCVPWNIFQEGAVTQAATDYIEATALMFGENRTRVLNLTFTGDLESYGVAIPSASEGVQIAVGGEYRSESMRLVPDEVYEAGLGGFTSNAEHLTASWDVRELFLEALVPVIQDTAGFRDLSLELGYRYSDYSTSGGSSTYKGLVNWAITDSWRLRGGYNRAVRAPNIWELYREQSRANGGGDICANDEDTGLPEGTLEQCLRTGVTEEQYGHIPGGPFGTVNVIWGGNPLLTPETADTVTAGVVWTPRSVPGLSITADYYDIKVTDTIDALWSDIIIQLCADTGNPLLCSLIHRDQTGSLWITEDAYVDETYQNIGLRSTSGVDLNLNWMIGLGNAGYLNTNLVATYLLGQRSSNPTYDFDCVGYYGSLCGQPSPKWRHRWRMTWETNFNTTFSLTWRRTGASVIDESSSDPFLSNPDNMDQWIASGSDTTPAYDWFDLAVAYSFRNGLQLNVGVNNIFDEEPPLLPGFADWGWINLYGNYDPLGRRVFASLQFAF